MKYKIKTLKIFSVFMVVFLLLANISVESFAKDKEDDTFTIEVEYGLDGITKTNVDMPINISITNNGKDFVGVVRVIIPDSYDENNNVAYDKDITIAAGTTKDISMYVRGNSYLTSFYVQMIDDKDQALYSEKVLCNFYENGDYAVMGILSDDYTALNYFDGVSFERGYFYGKLKIVELSEKNMPSTSGSLAVCNYILIDNYNTSKLSDEQIEAIKQWVSNGGVLIFGTGANYNKVFEKFDDEFIGGNIGGLHKEDISVAYGYEDGVIADLLEIEVNNSDDLAVEFDAYPLEFHEKIVGKGSVVVTNFDFALEPFTSWKNRKDMVSSSIEMMGTSTTTSILQDGGAVANKLTYSTKEYINVIPDIKKPSVILYALLFLLYVVFIGPIMYIILKAKNKREYMWIAIPISSVVCTLVIFATSIIYRVWQPYASSVTFVEFGENVVGERIYGSIQSPYTKAYSVKFNEDYMGYRPQDTDSSYYYYYAEDVKVTDKYDYVIHENSDGIDLEFSKKKAFTTRYFSVDKKIENSSQDIVIDFEYDYSNFWGTVQNNTEYDMKNVVVVFNDKYAIIGDLAAGEFVTITADDLEGYGYAYSIYTGFVYDVDRKYSYNSKEKVELENMINMVIDNYYVNDGVNGIVFGEIVKYKQDLVETKNITEYNNAVAVRSFTGEMPYEESSYYPSILELEVEAVGSYDKEDGYMNDNEVEITCMLPEDSNINQLIMMSNLDFESEYIYREFARVSMYNNETGDFDVLFEDGETIITDIEKYIDERRCIIMRCEANLTLPDGSITGHCIPEICAIGGEE